MLSSIRLTRSISLLSAVKAIPFCSLGSPSVRSRSWTLRIPASWSNFISSVLIAIFKTALYASNRGGRHLNTFFTSFFSLYFFPRTEASLAMELIFEMKLPIDSSSSIRRFSNLEARWSILVRLTLVFPSKWLMSVSHASLADSHPWMILNWSRSTAEKIVVRALELNFDAALSESVHLSLGKGPMDLSSITMVGTVHPCSTAVHASSSIPRMICLILAFQCPKFPSSNMIGFCSATSSFIVSMIVAGPQPVCRLNESTEVTCSDTKWKI